ncbi:two-component system, chemotaxis family, response regulator CheY [Syntrophus gentianae]|uniref:Two-component system, chemotaxis family, response regulator CheY n=1 Tax=Syntrophus gentianae TaxID=43775 RepID=A0A1H8A832_9BACT|nr:response regulator [Syntrophus gentianae]SEM66064.1 two-component system, chemotaxis family, response regulator CheY [Syntrophus gentianae]
MKAIVADDSRLIRGIIEKTTALIGFEAVQAGNGQEAMNILEANASEIHLVLLDWNMPILSGLDVIKKMRRDDRFKKIPVLMISTESEDDRIQEALSAGAQGYLTKPFTAEKLLDAIHSVLDNH